jgi:hypothetical protein
MMAFDRNRSAFSRCTAVFCHRKSERNESKPSDHFPHPSKRPDLAPPGFDDVVYADMVDKADVADPCPYCGLYRMGGEEFIRRLRERYPEWDKKGDEG